MCTVSWTHFLADVKQDAPLGGDGFDLFFNRDEARSRGPEQAPREFESRGVRYLAPTDGDAGGTWTCVNEFGLALGLLNGYHPSPADSNAPTISRGLLVRQLAPCASPGEAFDDLTPVNLQPYAPFVLVAVGPSAPARLLRWDGQRIHRQADADGSMPLSSSGIDPSGAKIYRDELLANARTLHPTDEARALLAFHTGEGLRPDALTTCMSRADAETRSLVHIQVRARQISLAHAAGRPDLTPLTSPQFLNRRQPN